MFPPNQSIKYNNEGLHLIIKIRPEVYRSEGVQSVNQSQLKTLNILRLTSFAETSVAQLLVSFERLSVFPINRDVDEHLCFKTHLIPKLLENWFKGSGKCRPFPRISQLAWIGLQTESSGDH